ncbi:hypothetical protein OU674_27065, partial [Escherichia coli]|nr:hypothetical protein [Escherichia coli]
KQKGSRGIRRGQRYRLVFQFPIREPTASIGEELAIKIITYIRQHCPTVIITTHNPRILELADHFFDGMSKSCVIAGEGRDQ